MGAVNGRRLMCTKKLAHYLMQSTLCLMTLLTGLTQSVCMYKHASEMRAGAINSDSRNWSNTLTDVAVPECAFPASRQALQVSPRRQSSTTQTPRTKKTRYALNARQRVTACNANSMWTNPSLTPPFLCTARGPVMWMGRTCKRSRDGAPCCQGTCKQDRG